MNQEYKFTIIIPVYNELPNLEELIKQLDYYQKFTTVKTKVLFIDDGSTDGSTDALLSICNTRKDFEFKVLQKNYGLSTAIKSGIDSCDTTWVGYIDADLQTLPQEFMRFFKHMDHYQMVTGIRESRQDNQLKKYASRFANGCRRRLIKDNIIDTCCPLKIMDSNYAKSLPFFKGMHRFLPALMQLKGGKVKQLPVQHFPRFAGKSKYHVFNRLFYPFLDMLAFIWIKRRHISYQYTGTNREKTHKNQPVIVNE